jgi:hypothetical protein
MADQNVDPIALASVYLQALGPQYDTANNRRALAAWFKAESHNNADGTITTHGYNALNWTVPALSPAAANLHTGTWSNPGHVFPTYDTPQAAALAWKDIVTVRFPTIGNSFKGEGDPISAIHQSNWTSGKPYATSYNLNTLTSVFNALGGNVKTPLAGGSKNISDLFPTMDPNTILVENVTGPNQVSVSTVAEEIARLTGEKPEDMRSWLADFVGKPISSIKVSINVPGLTVQGTTRSPAITDVAGNAIGNAVGGFTSVAQAVGYIATHLVPLAAIGLGTVFILFGGYIVYKSSENEPLPTPPLPVQGI